MRKKIVITVVAILLSFTVSGGAVGEVKAAVNVQSLSATEGNKLSQGIIQPKGQYLQSGSSSIGEVGKGKIKVVGKTIAQQVVSKIKVSVMVERKVGNDWLSYTSWNASDTNVYFITTSKTLTVPRGYYYRVRCVHSANTDVSDSNTNAIYVD